MATEKIFPTKHLVWVDKDEFDGFLAACRELLVAFDLSKATEEDMRISIYQIGCLDKVAQFVGDFDPAQPVPTDLPVEVHPDGSKEVEENGEIAN